MTGGFPRLILRIPAISITSSEMGHLYYVDLGNKGYKALDGTIQSDYGLKNTSFIDPGTGQTVSFLNM